MNLIERIKQLGRIWKPVHLCWLFRSLGLPAPPYFIGTTAAIYDQESFRFRDDDGSESGATWYAALNTDVNDLTNDTNYRIRINVKEQNTANGMNENVQFQYSKNLGTWTDITTTSSNIIAIASANFNDLDDTTQQLTTGGFDTTNNAMSETGEAGSNNLDPPQDSYVETELCFQIVDADVSGGDTIDIRVLFDLALDTWTEVPRITVAAGATTHQLAGTVDSVSLLSGTINVERSIAGTSDSVSLLSGAIGIIQQISGASDSISLLSGTLDVKRSVNGTTDSISLLSGTLRIQIDNNKLALISYNQPFQPPVPVSEGSLTQGNKQHLIWQYPGILWTGEGITHQLAGSVDSVSLLSGTIDVERSIAGTSDSISLLSGGINVTKSIIGSADSISLLSGQIIIDILLNGSSDSISLLTGLLNQTHLISGSSDSVSLLSGDLRLTKPLAGTVDSVSLLSGSIVIDILLAGSVDSISLLTGSIDLTKSIQGSVDSVSLLSGTLDVLGVIDLSGSVDSVSLLSGSINLTKDFIGSIDSISLLSGTLDVIVPGVIDLAGTIDSISLLSGSIDIKRDMKGNIDSVSLLSGSIVIDIPLAGSVDSISLLSGTLRILAKGLVIINGTAKSLKISGNQKSLNISGESKSLRIKAVNNG